MIIESYIFICYNVDECCRFSFSYIIIAFLYNIKLIELEIIKMKVMNKKLKIMFLRVTLSAIFLVSIMFISVDGWTKFFLFLIPYFIIGWDVVYKTIKHLCKFDLLD